MQVNIPIFGVQKANLREFTTTEKDMKRGYSRFPPTQFRLKEEDLIRESDAPKADPQDSAWTMMDDYQQNVQLRNKQFQETKDFAEPEDEYDDDEEKEPKTMDGGALIFTRKKD